MYRLRLLRIELSYRKPLSQEKGQSRRSMPMKSAPPGPPPLKRKYESPDIGNQVDYPG